MNGVFLDMVGLIAVWYRQDQWHLAASRVFGELVRAPDSLFSTGLILMECGNAASRRPYRSDVVELRSAMVGSGGLIAKTAEDEEAAWIAYQWGEAGGAGVVDRVSFVVMRRLGLKRAFSSDAHFRGAGFETLF